LEILVILVGPGTVASNLTPGIDWVVGFGPCVLPASPDPGILGTWDNSAPWVFPTNYFGTYYPNQGCLEDFDEGSANGSWLLRIENLGGATGLLTKFELIFCDTTGSECNECFLFAGEIELEPFPNIITFCQTSSFLEQFEVSYTEPPIVNTDQSTIFILSQDDQILSIEEEPSSFDTLSAGQYQICGIAYNQVDSVLLFDNTLFSELENIVDSRVVCADLTDLCLTLNILAPNVETLIDTFYCQGDTITLRGRDIFEPFDTTIVTQFLDIEGDPVCDSLISIVVRPLEIEANIGANQTEVNCGQALFLNGTNSTNNFEDNLSFTWATANGNIVNGLGPIAEIDQAGNYTLFAETRSCIDSFDIEITSLDTFLMTIEISDPVCVGDSFNVNLMPEVNLDDTSILGPELVTIIDDSFNVAAEGTYFLTSQFGTCTRLDTITLQSQVQDFSISVASTIIDCDNTASTITVTTDASNASFQYLGPQLINENAATVQTTTPVLAVKTSWLLQINPSLKL